jgi:hypothetical protein
MLAELFNDLCRRICKSPRCRPFQPALRLKNDFGIACFRLVTIIDIVNRNIGLSLFDSSDKIDTSLLAQLLIPGIKD